MKIFEDYDLSLRLASKYNLYFIPDVLVKAYISDNSISNNYDAAVYALQEIYQKYKGVIDTDLDICYTFNRNIGRYLELSGKNGKEYFAKANMAKRTHKNTCDYILSTLRLYKPIHSLYNSISKK